MQASIRYFTFCQISKGNVYESWLVGFCPSWNSKICYRNTHNEKIWKQLPFQSIYEHEYLCIFIVLVHLASWCWRGHIHLASYPLSFVRIWFYWTLLVLHEEPLFGLPVVLSISASAEYELNLSSKQHNNNNSQVHSGLPANFHCLSSPPIQFVLNFFFVSPV